MDPMTYAMITGGSAIISAWQSGQQSLNEQKAIYAQNRAKEKQMLSQLDLDTKTMYSNRTEINRQQQINLKNISKAELLAKDTYVSTFAGSGISGRTMSNIENQISRDANRAKEQVRDQSQRLADREFLGIMRESFQVEDAIKNKIPFDTGLAASNQALAGLSAAASTGLQLFGSVKFSK